MSEDRQEEGTPGSPRRVVVGLGNPGDRYAGTRHNVGFRVVDELARRRAIGFDREACGSRVADDGDPWLVAPLTYMNRSGFAVRCLAERHDLDPHAFLIVYDEIHLPLGSLRLRTKGSPAGHRGMESVLENMGSGDVPRLRLGVATDDGPEGDELVDFVLSPFEADEEEAVEEMIRRAADACELWAAEGPEPAMQKYNAPPGPPATP